jgi:hypothetical protein
MPWQNRVTPFGDIIATPERGTFFGNRGLIHNDLGRITRSWRLKRWLVCVLEFRGRKRTVMTPGRYTELFFLDEATALSAGHRPCAECRRSRFVDFGNAWKIAYKKRERPWAVEMDERLHAQRLSSQFAKKTFTAALNQLPDGVFITLAGDEETAYLVWRGALHAWSPAGYHSRLPRPRKETVAVLTPRSTVQAIQAGYVPEVHESAR